MKVCFCKSFYWLTLRVAAKPWPFPSSMRFRCFARKPEAKHVASCCVPERTLPREDQWLRLAPYK